MMISRIIYNFYLYSSRSSWFPCCVCTRRCWYEALIVVCRLSGRNWRTESARVCSFQGRTGCQSWISSRRFWWRHCRSQLPQWPLHSENAREGIYSSTVSSAEQHKDGEGGVFKGHWALGVRNWAIVLYHNSTNASLRCIGLYFTFANVLVGLVVLNRVKLEQATVLGLIEKEGVVKGVRYRGSDGQEMEARAPLTFVCDGCFSNLRRNLCDSKVWHFSASRISFLDLGQKWGQR